MGILASNGLKNGVKEAKAWLTLSFIVLTWLDIPLPFTRRVSFKFSKLSQ